MDDPSMYAGRGMFSLSQQADSKWKEDRRWLQGLQDVDLPPVDHLLDECLIQPIQEQVYHCNAHASSRLTHAVLLSIPSMG